MPRPLILASGSRIRRDMLTAAAVAVAAVPARIDEEAMRKALLAEQASPHDIADALAEAKARKVAEKNPEALVLGCDQVLEVDRQILSKPETMAQARDQLQRLRGKTHRLLSAAVLYDAAQPVWRHVGTVRLIMATFSDAYLDAYLQRNWPDIADSVGGYKLEKEGSRLFTAMEGDYFTVLGLPLLPLLGYLRLRGFIDA